MDLALKWTIRKIPVKYRAAGRIARTRMSAYSVSVISAIRKAAAPMMGGMI